MDQELVSFLQEYNNFRLKTIPTLLDPTYPLPVYWTAKTPEYTFRFGITQVLAETPVDDADDGCPEQQVHRGSSPMAYSCSVAPKTPEYKFWIGITQFSAKTPVDDAGDGRPGHQVYPGSSPMVYSCSATSKTLMYRNWTRSRQY